MTISDELKQAIRNSGFSINEIARLAGVSRPSVSRFLVDGDRGRAVSLATADKLATFFGLKLVRDESVVQPQPKPKPPTIASRVRTVLAKNPAGLTCKQIADSIETNGAHPRAIESALYNVKSSGKVRQNKRTGVYKLVKRPAKR